MSVADVFKVYLYADPITALYDYSLEEAEDMTSGILNVDIQYGTDIYEGPQQQIDTGQFTIVTRNPNMDPKLNPKLKYNSTIKFYDQRTGEFFRGYVTDIQVEYQRKDDPIITITGTDIFGAMQRVVLDQDTYDAIASFNYPGWNGLTFSDFIPYMNDFTSKYLDLDAIVPGNSPSPAGFWFDSSQSFGQETVRASGYAPAQYLPEVGESYLEIINKYSQTNLTSFSGRSGLGSPLNYNSIGVYTFPKYDPNYWAPQADPMITYTTYDFSSDPADGRPYQSILIDNGYNRVINQVNVSNESRTIDAGELNSVTENFTFNASQSIEDYAISKASISTIFPGTTTSDYADFYSRNIFQVTQYPGQEIQQITFDNARYEDIENEFSYSDYDINRIVRIKHQINNTETIDRVYDIAGISHNISPDNWEMTFTLKPNAQEVVFNYQGQIPRIQMNATTGDSNFNFTATLVDFDPTTVTGVVWALSATDSNEIGKIYPYATNGKMFKNGVTRTGFTQTWNFDDDGILAPYSFNNDGGWPNFNDNRYGGYGTGNWTVYAFVRLTNGFRVVIQQQLTVGTPVVEADFGWVQNTTNNFGQVAFFDTSVNHEVGEPDSYFWEFGDGSTSLERNPIYTYNPGPSNTEYEVSLTVFTYGSEGEKVYNTHTETVTLAQPTMTPNFTWTANAQVVTFTNTSTNVGFEEPDAYFWDFGTGQTSTLKNPVYTFPVTDVNTPQTFSVTLTTRNIWEQTASVTKTVTTTALNKSGTFPVRYIKFSIDTYTKPGSTTQGRLYPVTPVMSVLKSTTSGTGQNLSFLKPLTGFSDNYIPTVQHRATGGGFVQQANGWDFFLTRDIQTDPAYYGIGVLVNSQFDATYRPVRWELVVDLGTTTQLIDNINLRFEDLITLVGGVTTLYTDSFYPRINVQFANTVGGYTPNPAGVYGPPSLNGNWVNVGYIKLDGGRMDPTKPSGQRTNTTKNIFKMRPLPLNIPYFNYRFNPIGNNDKQVAFESVETGTSYRWTFGDGSAPFTTLTRTNVLKTYTNYGTYNVTLEVLNGATVTRTTTEPVIVQATVI